jgi:phosphate transport system substrate-binding protein
MVVAAICQNGICFSPYYYKEYIIREAVGAGNVKSIEINKIYPDAKSIKNKSYPFVANVYVTIRSDIDHNSMTYKLYEWLQTEAGKRVVREADMCLIKQNQDADKCQHLISGCLINKQKLRVR